MKSNQRLHKITPKMDYDKTYWGYLPDEIKLMIFDMTNDCSFGYTLCFVDQTIGRVCKDWKRIHHRYMLEIPKISDKAAGIWRINYNRYCILGCLRQAAACFRRCQFGIHFSTKIGVPHRVRTSFVHVPYGSSSLETYSIKYHPSVARYFALTASLRNQSLFYKLRTLYSNSFNWDETLRFLAKKGDIQGIKFLSKQRGFWDWVTPPNDPWPKSSQYYPINIETLEWFLSQERIHKHTIKTKKIKLRAVNEEDIDLLLKLKKICEIPWNLIFEKGKLDLALKLYVEYPTPVIKAKIWKMAVLDKLHDRFDEVISIIGPLDKPVYCRLVYRDIKALKYIRSFKPPCPWSEKVWVGPKEVREWVVIQPDRPDLPKELKDCLRTWVPWKWYNKLGDYDFGQEISGDISLAFRFYRLFPELTTRSIECKKILEWLGDFTPLSHRLNHDFDVVDAKLGVMWWLRQHKHICTGHCKNELKYLCS